MSDQATKEEVEVKLKQIICQNGGQIDLSLIKSRYKETFGQNIPSQQGFSSFKKWINNLDGILVTQPIGRQSQWFASLSNDRVEEKLKALLQEHEILDISSVRRCYEEMYSGEILHIKGSVKKWLQSFQFLSVQQGDNESQWMVKLCEQDTENNLLQDLTIDSSLISTPHDRERRQERGIVKIDLQRARRYGMVEDGKWRGSKRYTYAGHVFVYDEKNKRAITSWKIKESNNKSGTTKVNPILMEKSKDHDTPRAKKLHNRVKNALITKKKDWRSHSVFIVDMSGSMRTDDINGARCRSDGVWMTLAREFVKKQLDSGSISIYDIMSVVLMGEEAQVVFRYEPIDWTVYNKIVGLREWTTQKPIGHGNYIPAIEKAEELLNYNDFGSCALSLIFFSDGSPSDGRQQYEEIYGMVSNMASRFGRRLTVSCIGMADRNEDFSVLQKMVKEAAEFGCRSYFSRPSLSMNSLSDVMMSVTSSMASSKTELTELRTGFLRTVRNDVLREKQNAPDDTGPGHDWRVFRSDGNKSYLNAVYKWNDRTRDFSTVLDTRCAGCFKRVADSMTYDIISGSLCKDCKACYFCPDCLKKAPQLHSCHETAWKRRNHLIVKQPLPSLSVALKKSAFGEGAERLAFRFRFLDYSTELFIGQKMVAKESRFVETKEKKDEIDYLQSNRYSYHRVFVRTQATASRFASIYNRALDDLSGTLQSKGFAEKLGDYPRIHFVEPMVFELAEVEDNEEVKMQNVLVEPFIEGTYQKWNNNFGNVAYDLNLDDFTQASTSSGIELDSIAFLLGRKKGSLNNSKKVGFVPSIEDEDDGNHFEKSLGTGRATLTHDNTFNALLGAIAEECSDEDEGEEDSSEDLVHEKISHINDAKHQQAEFDDLIAAAADLAPPEVSYRNIPNGDFAQAFSHFSYVRSGGKIMVVDLQGSLQTNNENTSKFILTDPAIHKRRKAFNRAFNYRRLNFGRTDRGEKGIYAFFNSHVCNDACRLLGLKSRESMEQQKQPLEEDN